MQKWLKISKGAVKYVADCDNLHFYCKLCDDFSLKMVTETLRGADSSIKNLPEAVFKLNYRL